MGVDHRFPYPGLRSYESDESDLFFGREGCVDDMLERLAETSFLAVLGTSGSGKSSLVRTGLLDALELGFLPGRSSDWVVADMHPGGRPMHNLARTLVELDSGEVDEIELSLMKSFVTRGPRSLIQWCDDFGLQDDQSLILIVDQFEELFRYRDYAGREEAEAFVALLLESAKSDPRLHVVITMRSEFLGACAMMPGLAEQINSGLYLTRRMSRSECEQAIKGPARVIGFDVEPRLVSEILNDMASLAPWDRDDALTSLEQLSRRADQLPLMQHVLNRLYERARQEKSEVVLTLEDYKAIGRLRGAIDAHAEEILENLSEDAHAAAEPVFRSLITGTNLTNAVREPRRFQDLIEVDGGRETAVTELLDAFRAQGCSFLRPPPNVTLENDTIVDLGHESLIRQWSKLGEWLTKETRDAATWSRIVTAQTARKRGEGDLLSGLDLANALSWWSSAKPTNAWASRHGGDFEAVHDFVDESRKVDELEKSKQAQFEKARIRKLRTRAAVFLCLTFISVGAAFFGWNATLKERQARENATAAFDRADEALTSAQQANALAISASETFLVDMAERLRRTFGVKPEDVQLMLDEATAFLDQLDGQMPGNPNLRRMRGKLLLEYAWFKNDQSDYDGSLAYLDQARKLFETGEVPAADDAIVVIEIETLSARNRRYMEQYETGLQSIDTARDVLASLGPQMTLADQQLGNALINGGSAALLVELDRFDEAANETQACLSIGNPEENQRDLLAQKAFCAIVRLYAANTANTSPPPSDEFIAELQSHVEALSDKQRDLRDWLGWLSFGGQAAYSLYLREEHSEALTLLEDLVDKSQELVTSAPFNNRIRARNAGILEDLGYYYSLFGRSEEALAHLQRSTSELEFLEGLIETDPSFAETYRDSLSDSYAVIDDIEGWSHNVDMLALAAEVTGKLYNHAQVMVDAGMEICEACRFEPASFVAQVAEKQLENGDPAGAETLLDIYDKFKAVLDTLDPNEIGELGLVAANRTLFWIATDLPAGAKDRAAFDDPAEAIATFEASVERLEAYLEEFPMAAEVANTLAQAHVELAKLYNKAGRAYDAEVAVRRGVELENFFAIELLLAWADKGDGAIQRNPALAEEMADMLAAREWTPRVIPVILDQLWTEEIEEKASTVFVRDKPVGKDSAIDIALQENEALMGHRISEASIARLKNWEKQAAEAKKTFVRYYSQDVRNEAQDELKEAAEIEFRLRELAQANEVFDAAVIVYRQDTVLKKRDELTEALSNLLRNRTEVGYSELFQFVIEVGLLLGREKLPDQAILMFDVLLENADVLPVDRQMGLLVNRGELQDMAGRPEMSLQDYLLALSLDPSNYKLLNAVGYALTEQDDTLSLSISLLERAVEIEPENSGTQHYAMDSLGWAYVRNGQIERGLDFIKEAFVIGDDDQAEIMFHVAEAHRRLGSNDKAVAAYLLAREYRGSATVKDAIETGLNRLGYFPGHTNEGIESARDIIRAREGLSPVVAVDSAGVALQGYDTVVLLQRGELVRGTPHHWSAHDGGIWLFNSADAKALFDADPAKYAPAYGGYCAYCLASLNAKVPGKPEFATIANDRIYLHSSQINKRNWENSAEASVVQARSAWMAKKETAVSQTERSHLAPLLDTLAVGTQIQSTKDHVTFASSIEVKGIKAALASLGEKSISNSISADRSGVAIGGYDTVAYHMDASATRGSFEHWSIWQGAVWLFESEDNRARFEADPDKYAPVFGGFCAFCLSQGSKSHGDPRLWVIVDGTLSLSISDTYRQAWIKNHERSMKSANENWSSLNSTSNATAGPPSRFVALLHAVRNGADVRSVEW